MVAKPVGDIGLSVSHRGSLPLKKRRCSSEPAVDSSTKPPPLPTTDDEKIAALALLASAATPLHETVQFSSKNKVGGEPKHVETIGPSPITPIYSSSSTEASSSVPTERPPIYQQHRPRVHHPPLAAPLPGGCHGRTSRNNSYCRRQPCYNGSQYCKLHYQQYIIAGTRAPTGTGTVLELGSSQIVCAAAHQDKRFTGCDGEVRCHATTTRGRACAYISVNDTKYCHLHADYDTNPPPKRGGSNTGSGGVKSRQIKTLIPNFNICPPIPDLSTGLSLPTRPALSAREVSPSSSDASRSSSSTQAPNARPFLSSISSDQWYHKRVMIATGPLVNRIGLVEKWGNGWVTVRVRDGVLHNRRSIELFLLPNTGEDSDSLTSDENGINRCGSGDHSSLPSPSRAEKGESNSVNVLLVEAASLAKKIVAPPYFPPQTILSSPPTVQYVTPPLSTEMAPKSFLPAVPSPKESGRSAGGVSHLSVLSEVAAASTKLTQLYHPLSNQGRSSGGATLLMDKQKPPVNPGEQKPSAPLIVPVRMQPQTVVADTLFPHKPAETPRTTHTSEAVNVKIQH